MLRLSPTGILHLDHESPLKGKFSKDWREGWFELAANKSPMNDPTLSFWQRLAEQYLTELCHLPEEEIFSPIEIENLAEWVIRAPPMIGGEYLSIELLKRMWNELNLWMAQQEDVHQFLKKRAPKWQQVGRVCFHLAENKNNPDRPFAFLATYSTGFSAAGRVKHLPLKKAIEQYSGQKNQQALVKLLTPVQNAANACKWVENLLKTAELYQPLAWSPKQAYQFLTTIPQLEESGLSIKIPNWWKKRPRAQVAVTIGNAKGASLGANALLDFNVQVAIGDQHLTKDELRQLAMANDGLAYIRGQWVEVDNEKLQEALEHWKSVQQSEISFIEGMRLLAGTPSSLQPDEMAEKQHDWVKISAGDTLANLLEKIRDPSQLPFEQKLNGLKATLRPYQKEGVSWLSLLTDLGIGACLADDMGLGKTLQILSLMLTQKEGPSLLVVPASLLGNWKLESERFTPSVKLLFAHPSETPPDQLAQLEEKLQNYDLIITTYSMVIRLEWLLKIDWNLLILDEAQAIKNSDTKQSRLVKKLKSRSRIALTGTPIENRLSDLWSLFDFLNPGLLGSASHFRDYVKSCEQFDPLRRLVSPYILRRMKTDPKIISDLPEKIETPTYCQLTKEQAHHYQSTVDDLKKTLEIVEPKNRRGAVLQTLLRLKQICNHPAHFSGSGDYTPDTSGKFLRLRQICEELASRQEKVLIFTQFSEIIPHIADHLSTIFERKGLILHGATPIKKRKELVQDFQSEDGPPFFVISLKAGGTGLTLTAASHVIHFDRWWNPAVENQATDRAFRIGQNKNVQVHKFITQGTVEEQIDHIISSKKKLASDLLETSEEIKVTELSDNELLNLVALDITKIKGN